MKKLFFYNYFKFGRINKIFYLFAGKIGLFYLIFYGVLAALVAICFWGFFQTLDPRIPRWQLERSIIGTNPGKLYILRMNISRTSILYFILLFVGLGFRPQPPLENVESTLIWYRGTDSENFKYWIDSLESFLKGKVSRLYETCKYVQLN